MVQNVLNFRGHQAGINRDQDTSSRRNPIMSFKERRSIGAQKSDSIMFLEANHPQPGGQPVDPLRKLTIGITPLPMDNGHFIRKDKSAPPEEADGRQFGAVDIVGHDLALYIVASAIDRNNIG